MLGTIIHRSLSICTCPLNIFDVVISGLPHQVSSFCLILSIPIPLITSRNVFVIELLAKHCPSGNFTSISPFVLVRFSLLGLSCATKSSPNSIFNPKDNCSFIAFNCRNFVSEFDCVLRCQPLQTGFIHSLYLGYISFDNNGRWHDSSFILAITPSPNSCIVAIIVSVVLL